MSSKKQITGREFVSLMTVNQRRIYAYILTLIPNMHDADDVLQETTALMWKKKEAFEFGTDFAAWGARIAFFKVLEYRRETKKDGYIIIPDDQFNDFAGKALEESVKTDELISRMKDCLKRMSSADQYLIHLRYSIPLSVKEIACRINKSVRSIYYDITRIHGLLMDCIEGRRS